MPAADVKTQLLDEAQALAQARGYHGFSYGDLAAKVRITTASIHYHFPTKADMVVALARRYRAEFEAAMEATAERTADLAPRLDALVATFAATLDRDRVCLIGALAGEFRGLPTPVQRELRKHLEIGETWLERFFADGAARGQLREGVRPAVIAKVWFSTLQGALLVARAGDAGTLRKVAEGLRVLCLVPLKGRVA